MTVSAVEQLSPLHKGLRKDFFLSFMHSQGSPSLQEDIFVYMAQFYAATYGKEATEAMGGNTDFLKFYSVPRGHHDPDLHDYSADRDLMSADLVRKIVAPEGMPVIDVNPPRIARAIIGQDIKFQDVERKIGTDVHASYFRTHVILQQTTGAEVFDALYADIRADARQFAPSNLGILANCWSATHDGTLFDPAHTVIE